MKSPRFACAFLACATLIFVPGSGFADSPDEVIVTATPLGSGDNLRAADTIDRQESLFHGGGTLGEVLHKVPGVATSSFAVGASRPIIRGLDNERVRVQHHGIDSHDVSAISEDHGVPLDPLAAQRFEVLRGPGALRYGSNAIGGVVTVMNDRVHRTLPGEAFSGELVGALESVNDGRETGFLADMTSGNTVLHADGFYRRTDDYDTPQGTQDYTSSRAYGGALGASLVGSSGFAGLSIAHTDADYDIPAPEDPLAFIGIELQQTRLQGAAGWQNPFNGIDRIEVEAGYTDYEHDEIEGGVDVGSTFKLEQWEARTEWTHAPVGGFTGVIGLQGGQRDLRADGEGADLLAPTDTRQMAIFVFEETQLTDLVTLELAGRIEHVTLKGEPIDGMGVPFAAKRSFTPMSASAGVVFGEEGGWQLGALGQYVERAPDVLSLFAKGPHHATETFEVGDASLTEEKAWSGEMRLTRELGLLNFDASVFVSAFDGFIFKQRSGVLCNEDFASCGAPDPAEEQLEQVIFMQQDARFWGAEISIDVPLIDAGGDELVLNMQGDFVRARLDNGGGDVPRVPPARIGGGLEYNNDAGWHADVFVMKAFEQDRLAAFETVTEGYTLVDMTLAKRLDFPNHTVDVALVGKNLLDEEVRNHSSFKKEDVLQPGRSVRFVVRIGL